MSEHLIDDSRARRAVIILTWAQSVLGMLLPVHMVLGGLAGAVLAPSTLLATLPISLMVLGSMIGAPTLSAIMARTGRRAGFLGAALMGSSGGFLAAHAIDIQSFALFGAASFLIGLYVAGHNLYRFAATDMASDAYKPKAISWVLAGGLIAALLGPEVIKRFGDLMEPVPYAGAYLVMGGVMLAGALPLFALDIPRPAHAPQSPRQAVGRPLAEILREPRVAVAVLCGMSSYAMMTLMMTATPLAMAACGFTTDPTADVVRAHVLAMYAPSLITGRIVARFGPVPVVLAGQVCLALAGGIAMSGITYAHFMSALILLGLGWNFGFIGATAMLSTATRPEEQARVQGFNDFAVMALVLVASLGSGAVLDSLGWMAVQAVMLPLLTLAVGALAWLHLERRAVPAP
ncbi:MAG: MFS transporter [Pseudomonadota bacterium]